MDPRRPAGHGGGIIAGRSRSAAGHLRTWSGHGHSSNGGRSLLAALKRSSRMLAVSNVSDKLPTMGNALAKVYVDNNVISLITELRAGAPTVSEIEVDGLDRLCDDPALEFVTSEQTMAEFRRAAGPLRVALKLLGRLIGLTFVPMQPTQIPNARIMMASGRSRIIAPPSRPDELYEGLRTIFDDDDARHILNAVRASCHYFLTLDMKTILRPARQSQAQLRTLGLRIDLGAAPLKGRRMACGGAGRTCS